MKGDTTPAADAVTRTPPAGNIGGIRDGVLRGWCHLGDGRGPAELWLLMSGRAVARTIADLPRPDVARGRGIDARCGFTFDLSALDTTLAQPLTVVHRASGYDFHNTVWTYCSAAAARLAEHERSLRALFFPEHYRHRHRLEHLSNGQSFRHYIEIGVYRDHDPCPWFSNAYYRERHADLLTDGDFPVVSYLANEGRPGLKPSALFDPQHYADACNDPAVTEPLAHFVQHGRFKGCKPLLQTLPEHIEKELEELVSMEPALAITSTGPESIRRCRFPTGAIYVPRLVRRRFGEEVDVVICVPFVSLGEPDPVAPYLLKAYQQAYGKERVLLIVTDRSRVDVPSWPDEGTRLLCLEQECSFLNAREKIIALHSIIGLLVPSKVVNVASRAAWELYREYGAQMATATSLYAHLSCFDRDARGRRTGYIPEYVPSLIGSLACVFCDNRAVIDEMRDLYGFSDEDMRRFDVVYTPAPEGVARRASRAGGNRSVLWIGPLTRQKRPELLLEIAASMPEQRFVVYGPEGDSPAAGTIVRGECPNIEYRGVYTSLDEIDPAEHCLFLDTSAWEGLSTVLVHTMRMGLPVVSSLVGGTAELVTEETGWPVERGDAASAYVAEIRRAMGQPSSAERKVENGSRLIERRHRWEAFYQRLGELGAFGDEPAGAARAVLAS